MVKYYIDKSVDIFGKTTYIVKLWNGKTPDMVKWCNNLDGEMVKLPQWGFGEMSQYNDIIFLPPSTPFPHISICINCVRGRFYSSIYALCLPLPPYSP